MWMGETEHNIRDAFEEARRDRAILFLDEADTFFINRETATRSWENSQTNELLTQMENHGGILICCTNLLEHLDGAVMRRFTWKIQFKPLTVEGRTRLFGRYFLPNGGQLPEEGRRRLAAMADLTAGDIRAVWEKRRFPGGSLPDAEALIEELRREIAYRKGAIGRLGFAP